jgi:4-amino-4-deoxy-L-arabinose transferase-like glycosyltransferase
LPQAFEQEFLLVHDGKWFGKYPPGYPLVLAAGVWSGVPWAINPLLATVSLATLYSLGRLLYDRRVASLVVLLALTSPFFLFMSSSMMAHPAELLWISTFMVAWLLALRRQRGWLWALLAGACLGLAFLTRQLAALSAGLPFLLLSTALAGRRGLRFRATRLAAFAGPLLLAGASLLFYQWAVTGDPFQDPRLLFEEFDRAGFGPDVGLAANVMRVDLQGTEQIQTWYYDPTQPPRGHTLARGLYNVERNWWELERHLFGWPPITTIAFIWLLFLLPGRARRPADWLLLASGTAAGAVYVSYWHAGIMYGPRYFYAAMPALLLLTAAGIEWSGRWLGGRSGQAATMLLAGALVAGNLLTYLPGQVAAHRGYNFVDGTRLAAVGEAISGPALVLVDAGSGDWWEYGTLALANSPWLDNRVIFARDLGRRPTDELIRLFPERAAYRLVGNQVERLDGRPP